MTNFPQLLMKRTAHTTLKSGETGESSRLPDTHVAIDECVFHCVNVELHLCLDSEWTSTIS